MSTDPTFKCGQCHKYKLSGEYGTRQRGSMHGLKGDRLWSCLSCSALKSATRKRKRTENNPGHPAKRLATQPPASPSQFMEALAKYVSAAEIDGSWRVSVDDMTLPDKDIANHLASLAWKATGYRFSFNSSRTAAGGSSTRFTYECCQARGTANDMAKRSFVAKEKQRTSRRMERFNCHGRLHVAVHNGVALVDIIHCQSHESYPEKWRTSIKNNHKTAPIHDIRGLLLEDEQEDSPSPAALGLTGQESAPLQHSSPPTASQSLVSSPQEGYGSEIDGLLCESEPDGFTEPPSLDEQYENAENLVLRALDLLRSRRSHLDSDWLAEFCENADPLFKFMEDTIRDMSDAP